MKMNKFDEIFQQTAFDSICGTSAVPGETSEEDIIEMVALYRRQGEEVPEDEIMAAIALVRDCTVTP